MFSLSLLQYGIRVFVHRCALLLFFVCFAAGSGDDGGVRRVGVLLHEEEATKGWLVVRPPRQVMLQRCVYYTLDIAFGVSNVPFLQ